MPRFITELYKKNKEFILYIIFGVGTTAVNFAVLWLLGFLFDNVYIANVIAWIAAVTFAYVTNKVFVYKSHVKGKKMILEILAFFYSRSMTLLLEELMLFVLHGILGINEFIVKCIASVFVIILNYIIGKVMVFRKKK